MNFAGTGKRLEQGEIGSAAKLIGVDTSVLLAFLEVESAGRGFDLKNRPKMLFEPHVFWRQLGNIPARQEAIKEGIAYKKWIPGKYPKDSYPRLQKAVALQKTAGLKSASYGLGQILGPNFAAAGHKTVVEFVETAMQGEFEQLTQMVVLMKSWGMVGMLTARDFSKSDSWRPASRKWNGVGYAKHGHHVKLANAYKKHERAGDPLNVVIYSAGAVLKIGSKGEAVRNLQIDLRDIGYDFISGVDGRFGPETESIVKKFQADHGLTADGFAGSSTLAKIENLLVDKTPAQPVFDKELLSLFGRFLKWLTNILSRNR